MRTSSGPVHADALPPDSAIWLLSSFSALYRVPFDPALFRQRFPPPVAYTRLAEAADEIGLSCDCTQRRLGAVLAKRLPAAVLLKPLPASGCETPAGSIWAVVLNADEERVILIVQGENAPTQLPLHQLDERYAGTALWLVPKASPISDPDGVEERSAHFGLRWFIPEVMKHKRIWRDVLAGSLVLQLMGLALPLFTQVVIDKVVVHRTSSTLIALGVAMMMFVVFTSALSWIRQYLVLHTGQRIDAVLGSRVFERLLRLPLLYFQHRPTGVISARLQGIDNIRQFIASAATTVVLDIPFLIVFIGIMFWYSLSLTLLVLTIVALIAGASLLVAPLFRERLNEQFRRGAANQAFLTEYISGIETVKSLQCEPQLNQRFRGLLAEYLGAGFTTSQLANGYNVWANGLEQLMSTLILVLGAWIVMTTTDLSIGMLVAFQMFASRVSQPLLRMVGLWQQWQQTRMSISRLGDIMNAPAEQYSLLSRRSPAGNSGSIQAEGLSFRYAPDLPYLYENLTLNIASGNLIAIMGPSGAGKSTFAKLLQGFYAPTQGRIRIDDVDITHLHANELRATFGVVPQETVLFSGTILENLKLANPYASFEQVVAACRMSDIHSTIEALPSGYQTEIGERGVGLSGGQRQRLSIARALLKGPRILIFDEATSSVDQATAEQLCRTINALKGRATILFIAHILPRSLQVDHVIRIGEKLSVIPGGDAARSVDAARSGATPA